jgi:D-glycero-D-manno-heptose 1,7-bisphosphate phosphatase
MKKVIVLDRDGVINQDLGRHVLRWSEFEFIPGALSAIGLITAKCYGISIASNQSALSAGTLTQENLDDITLRMRQAITASGGIISRIHYCPHVPFYDCDCRKPKAGMLEAIAREHDVKTTDLTMVGDSWRDIQAARACGARPVLVLTGKIRTCTGYSPFVECYNNLLEFAACLTSQKHESV